MAEEVERAFATLAELQSQREALERFLELFEQKYGVPELQDDGCPEGFRTVDLRQLSSARAFLARGYVAPAQPLGA